MSRCNKIVCDLCGEHMDYVKDDTIKIKIKKYYTLWEDCGWEKKRVHICPECVKNFRQLMKTLKDVKSDKGNDDE